jgi:hypothetical protein
VKESGACAPFRLLFYNRGTQAKKKNDRKNNLDNVQNVNLHRISPSDSVDGDNDKTMFYVMSTPNSKKVYAYVSCKIVGRPSDHK